jgi:DtxR family Mn-dependent transcriptional regulator
MVPRMATSGEFHPASEEYCECIFKFGEDNLEIAQVRISERLDVSRAAVSELLKRLQAGGLVATDGGVRLTPEGERVGERTVRRRRLAERFLADTLHISWADAHYEAGTWEHVMSESVERLMDELIGHPTTCPHGNPIPGSAYEPAVLQPLPETEAGQVVAVRRITEELEFEPGLLEFLEASAIQPGEAVSVTSASPDRTPMVRAGAIFIGIAPFTNKRILVST